MRVAADLPTRYDPGPMFRFRLLLAWLVMAALPLQGFAAVSMLFCGVERAAAAHDHSSHRHATTGHSASEHTNADSGAGAKADQEPQGHACAACASCYPVVAVGGFEPIARSTAAPPGVAPSAPLVRVATRTTPVPDKPPRA